MFLRFASVHGPEHSLTNYKLHGLMSVKKLSVLLMLRARRALLELTHATDRQSCRGDSSRTRRAVIGKELENFHEDFLVKGGLCCRQLPFQNETDHQCGELVQVRQPCSNLNEQRRKRLSVAWHENFCRWEKKNFDLLFLFFSCLPIDFTFSCLHLNISFREGKLWKKVKAQGEV